jgi:hypothetical protein
MTCTERRISPERVRWALAAVAALLGAALVFPAAASAKAHGPDLVVRVKIEDLGTPPRILLGASGTAPRFTIVVRTENTGDRAAGPSKAKLHLHSGILAQPFGPWTVKPLGPGQGDDHTVIVHDLTPDLGFTDVVASVEYKNAIHAQQKKIAVEPREWDVSKWTTEDTGFSIDNATNAGTGFYLRFQKYDHGFVYQAFGPVTDTPKSYPGCAPVSGSKTITQTPWAGSIVTIDPDLLTYDGFVPTSTNSFMATCNIGGSSFPLQVAFIDLTTGKVVPKKKPDDTELSGTDTVPVGGGTETSSWDFTAHVPKP